MSRVAVKGPRSVKDSYALIRETIIMQFLDKIITANEAAKLLNMHPKSFSRLKRRYLKGGKRALIPKRTGPKSYLAPSNRITERLENMVLEAWRKNRDMSHRKLAALLAGQELKLHPSTVWRVIRRRKGQGSKLRG